MTSQYKENTSQYHVISSSKNLLTLQKWRDNQNMSAEIMPMSRDIKLKET